MPGAGAPPRKRQAHWTRQALEDLAHWDDNDRRVASRIRQLVEQIEQQPFTGIGKPEPLRYEWSGYWSRRITDAGPHGPQAQLLRDRGALLGYSDPRVP